MLQQCRVQLTIDRSITNCLQYIKFVTCQASRIRALILRGGSPETAQQISLLSKAFVKHNLYQLLAHHLFFSEGEVLLKPGWLITDLLSPPY